MKLESGRTQDIKDVSMIITSEKNAQPLDLIEQLKEMGFTIDILTLLEAYGMAHGMDWLMAFYYENEEHLLNL